MRLSYVRLPLLAATVWMGIGFSVRAMDIRYGETVYITPTSTTYSLAPSYVVSSSFVTPAAYVVPSYFSTGYVVPSSYSTTYIAEPVTLLPTTYVATTYRRGLLGRRWLVERPVTASYGTTYLPTSYATTYIPSSYVFPTYYTTSYRLRTYTPTVYEYPAMWETAAVIPRGDCDEVVWTYPARPPASASSTSPRANDSTRAAQSESTEDPTIPSNVDPLLSRETTPRALPRHPFRRIIPLFPRPPRRDRPRPKIRRTSRLPNQPWEPAATPQRQNPTRMARPKPKPTLRPHPAATRTIPVWCPRPRGRTAPGRSVASRARRCTPRREHSGPSDGMC